MFDFHIYVLGLAAITLLAVMTWLVSVAKRNVTIVDSLWSILFLASATVYVTQAAAQTQRGLLVLALVAAWALRLSIYLSARNWGQPEDHRYQKIRANNEPNF